MYCLKRIINDLFNMENCKIMLRNIDKTIIEYLKQWKTYLKIKVKVYIAQKNSGFLFGG